MAKMRTRYVCQNCGTVASRWFGRCTGCEEWNTCVEEILTGDSAPKAGSAIPGDVPRPITEIDGNPEERVITGIGELDRTLGGGIVPGGAVLVGGDPGIGKSTLLLQGVGQLALAGLKVLYVSAEESAAQVKMRSQRVGVLSENLFLVSESNLHHICEHIGDLDPTAVVVDSVQTIFHPDLTSAPGSVSQVRECAAKLVNLAKTKGNTLFLVGHVTKEGTVAGPKVLEHLVDTVLYLEGDRHGLYRILRAAKNRFGSTNEIGVFHMGESGMAEVTNPSQVFLSDRSAEAKGNVAVCSIEGTRPILAEIQALVSNSSFGYPQRVATGFDSRRMAILIAVLEKRCGLNLGSQDVFINVAGGLRTGEPSVDLGAALAMASSFRDRPISGGTLAIGEVGLGGEIRPVAQAGRRVIEAHKLGFNRCLLAKPNLVELNAPSEMDVVGVADINAAQDVALGGG
jgi:DNA repair protein RadA/Sms